MRSGDLHELGYRSMIISYRNDPGLPKDPTGIFQYGTTEWKDINGAINEALKYTDNVILWGTSGGGGPASSWLENVGDSNKVKGIIYEAPDGDSWEKIAHLGGVEIGANVEVGANSVIDRGALGNTKIGDGVKMDNHIHIAHNVSVGENTAMAGMVGIAGSVKIGKNCKFGGQVGTVDHIEITDNVTVLAKTLVTKSLTEPGAYSGVMPIQKHKDSLKFAAKLKK